MFSLQNLSLIKLASILCNNRQLLNLILQRHFHKLYPCRLFARKGENWDAVQTMANELISQLCNCVALNKMILEYLWPLSYRIMLWKLEYASSIENEFLEHFHWTNEGRIDNKRTAKCIIGNKNISNRSRFILACNMCLEKEINEIWAESSNDEKMHFDNELNEMHEKISNDGAIHFDNELNEMHENMSIDDEIFNEEMNPLICFWINTVKGSYPGCTISEILEYTSEYGLLEAVKYFFNLLTANEKNSIAESCLGILSELFIGVCYIEEDETDIICLLLSGMRNEDRETLLRSPDSIVLVFSLYASDQEHFFKLWAKRYQYLYEPRIIRLFLRMLFNMLLSDVNKDIDYFNLFFGIWRSFHPAFRSRIASGPHLGPYCLGLLIKQDFPFLLKEGAFKKVKELTSDLLLDTVEKPFDFHQERWEFLLRFIQEDVVTVFSLEELGHYLTSKEFNWEVLKSILIYIRSIRKESPNQDD